MAGIVVYRAMVPRAERKEKGTAGKSETAGFGYYVRMPSVEPVKSSWVATTSGSRS
jgi:hypothetical protein